jgi:hypothetical protein
MLCKSFFSHVLSIHGFWFFTFFFSILLYLPVAAVKFIPFLFLSFHAVCFVLIISSPIFFIFYSRHVKFYFFLHIFYFLSTFSIHLFFPFRLFFLSLLFCLCCFDSLLCFFIFSSTYSIKAFLRDFIVSYILFIIST